MVGWASAERVALLGNSPRCPSFSRVSSSFVVVLTVAIAYALAADRSGALRSSRRGCNVLRRFGSNSSWIWLVGCMRVFPGKCCSNGGCLCFLGGAVQVSGKFY